MGSKPNDGELGFYERIKSLCPSITQNDYQVTSKATNLYNCVAWVLDDEARWWEPVVGGGYYWPSSAELGDYSIQAYTRMFEEQGFLVCGHLSVEDGFEKIALYANADGEFTHVASQRISGRWSSKLGDWEDIEHEDLAVLEGGPYGSARTVMSRKRTHSLLPL